MSLVSASKLRTLGFAGLTLLLSVGAAAAQTTSTLYKVLERGTLRVGTTGDYDPMTIFDPKTNSHRGYEIDAANRLAADLGVKVEFVKTDWKSLVQGLSSDKFDIIMSGTSLSLARLKTVGFSRPYNEYFMIALALKENAGKYKTWDDVNQKAVKVSVTLGTNFEGLARENLPSANLVRVEPPAQGYQEVLAGRSDLALTSSTEAAGLIKTYPNLQIILADAKYGKQIHGYMVKQDDFVWINYINRWLDLREADGVLPALRQKWLALH
jgi:cyclohexadienyl dehydratase